MASKSFRAKRPLKKAATVPIIKGWIFSFGMAERFLNSNPAAPIIAGTANKNENR